MGGVKRICCHMDGEAVYVKSEGIKRVFSEAAETYLIKEAGFSKVHSRYMTFGVCAMHVATK